MSDLYLEMKGINKSFSGVKVLNNVSFNIKKGEVHVLLGENGAGKSTLIKILSGAYEKTSGNIYIEDKEVDINNPQDAINLGISVIYQEFNLNPYMTIYENIFLGKELVKKLGFINKKASVEKAKQICKRVGLHVSPTELVKNLSVAQKQMLEIAKALMMNVKVLVLDEPTATLTEKEINKLFDIIKELKQNGVGIVYISHRMNELTQIGDRCTVLRDGNYIDTVNIKDITSEDLIHMMVGRNVSFEKRLNSYIKDEAALKVDSLSYRNLLKNISFTLRKGEILGVAGLVGSGRTELAKCIIGEFEVKNGIIYVRNKKMSFKSPADSIKNKIVYLSEDRKNEGLILKHDVKTNISLPSLDKIKKKILLNGKIEKEKVTNLVEKFRVKTFSINTPVKNLSGGNQQKVVISKWFFRGADVYIIDEPTRGIDVGARQEIYNIMEELTKNGAAIIMISSDLIEILKMSDNILVMCNGMVSGYLNNDDTIDQSKILKHAIGIKCDEIKQTKGEE